MGEQLVIVGVFAAIFVVLLLCLPILGAQMELRRVRREYLLTDEEAEAYARELPEVCHAIADSLGPGASSKEVRRMARESTITAILKARRHRRAGMAGALSQTEMPPQLDIEPGKATTVTREDLVRERDHNPS